MKRTRILLGVLLLACVAGPGAAADRGDDAPSSVPTRDGALRLAEFEFDPLQGAPVLPEGWQRSATGRPDLHLVQFDGPLPVDALDRMRARGLEPVRYVHPDTYIVWGHRADRQAMHQEPAVRASADFAPAYRVQPRWRELGGDAVDVKILLYRGAELSASIQALTALGGTLAERVVVDARLEVAGFLIPGDRLRQAAAVPGVYSIQAQPTDGGSRGEVSDQINAGNIDGADLAFPGYQTWLAGLGLDGGGVVVADVDEGIDETHPELAPRMLACVGISCSTQSSFHGTHTAGIIAGDGSTGAMDSNGFLRGLGVAPGAGLVEQRYFPTMNQTGGMLRLMTDSVQSGAVVSNNSWGPSSNALGYDVNTMLVDVGVRDADPGAAGQQPLIYVQAIDNGNGGVSTQGVPDDAKNIITVGASLAMTNVGDPDPGHNNLYANSGHGPALDGRTIPHLVAPGCFVDSTFPTASGSDHGVQCGSSFAAPQVSGAAALFVEAYRNLTGTDPSPALVKSALLPVAHDLEGFLDADGLPMGHRPDDKQGWGRLNLSAVIAPSPGSVLYFDQTTVFRDTGGSWRRAVTPLDPAKPMRIMLAWTDAPGHGLGGATPAWNNDLDLVVEVDGDTYHGNDFGVDGFSVTGGVADPMNNAEGVFLQGLTGSEVTLRVLASNINSDGVPGNEDDTDQDFALTCYNCVLVPGFALSALPPVVDVCAPNDATYLIDVEQLAGYSETVTLTATDLPAGTSAVFGVNPVAPGGTSSFTISDTGSGMTGDYTIGVEGDSVDQHRSMSVFLRLRDGSPVPALLTAPADATVDVDPRPTLQWDPSPWTDGYLVEVSEDPAFGNLLYNAVSMGTSHSPSVTLSQMTTYYWRVRATNPCGFGDFSLVSSFTTGDVPSVLLVDDDWDVPNVGNSYKNALNSLGVAYDTWDVNAVYLGDEPDALTLASYDKIVWFSGEEELFAGPSADSEQALDFWMDRTGCLMISGSDYVFSRGGLSAFMQNRLGVASVDEDTEQNVVTGMGSVFTGLGPFSLQGVTFDYSDSLTPDATAEVAFEGDLGTAAVNKDGGYFRSFFSGFEIDRLPGSPGNQGDVIGAFLGWCDGLVGLDGDGDGVANELDCVAGDPDAWVAPSPITDLRLGKDPASGFVWSQPVSGGGAVYDVLRSVDPADFYNATCPVAGVSSTSAPADDDPQPGGLWFYLARARNDCGLSSLGDDLDGSPRHGTACP